MGNASSQPVPVGASQLSRSQSREPDSEQLQAQERLKDHPEAARLDLRALEELGLGYTRDTKESQNGLEGTARQRGTSVNIVEKDELQQEGRKPGRVLKATNPDSDEIMSKAQAAIPDSAQKRKRTAEEKKPAKSGKKDKKAAKRAKRGAGDEVTIEATQVEEEPDVGHVGNSSPVIPESQPVVKATKSKKRKSDLQSFSESTSPVAQATTQDYTRLVEALQDDQLDPSTQLQEEMRRAEAQASQTRIEDLQVAEQTQDPEEAGAAFVEERKAAVPAKATKRKKKDRRSADSKQSKSRRKTAQEHVSDEGVEQSEEGPAPTKQVEVVIQRQSLPTVERTVPRDVEMKYNDKVNKWFSSQPVSSEEMETPNKTRPVSGDTPVRKAVAKKSKEDVYTVPKSPGAAATTNAADAPKSKKRKRKSDNKTTEPDQDQTRPTPKRIKVAPDLSEYNHGPFNDAEIEQVNAVVGDICRAHKMSKSAFNEAVQNLDTSQEPLKELYTTLEDELKKRTRRALMRFCQRHYNNYHRGPWDDEQDQQLRDAYEEKPNKWKEIAEKMGRLPGDCRDRWRNHLQYGDAQNKSIWTEEEEADLRRAVEECAQALRDSHELGPEDEMPDEQIIWSVVSQKMGGKRSRLQCKYKWKKFGKRAERYERDRVHESSDEEQPQSSSRKIATKPKSKKQATATEVKESKKEKKTKKVTKQKSPPVRELEEHEEPEALEQRSVSPEEQQIGDDEAEQEVVPKPKTKSKKSKSPKAPLVEETEEQEEPDYQPPASKQRRVEEEVAEEEEEGEEQQQVEETPKPRKRNKNRRTSLIDRWDLRSDLQDRHDQWLPGDKYAILCEMRDANKSVHFADDPAAFWTFLSQQNPHSLWSNEDREFLYRKVRKQLKRSDRRNGVDVEGMGFSENIQRCVDEVEATYNDDDIAARTRDPILEMARAKAHAALATPPATGEVEADDTAAHAKQSRAGDGAKAKKSRKRQAATTTQSESEATPPPQPQQQKRRKRARETTPGPKKNRARPVSPELPQYALPGTADDDDDDDDEDQHEQEADAASSPSNSPNYATAYAPEDADANRARVPGIGARSSSASYRLFNAAAADDEDLDLDEDEDDEGEEDGAAVGADSPTPIGPRSSRPSGSRRSVGLTERDREDSPVVPESEV